MPAGYAATKTSPTFYLDDIIKQYQQIGDLQLTLEHIASSMVESINNMPDMNQLLNFEVAKEWIVMELVNSEQNKEMLMNMPHREHLDLSVIYRWILDADKAGDYSILVDHNIAGQIGMHEDALHMAAMENTKRLFPPVIKEMSQIIRRSKPD